MAHLWCIVAFSVITKTTSTNGVQTFTLKNIPSRLDVNTYVYEPTTYAPTFRKLSSYSGQKIARRHDKYSKENVSFPLSPPRLLMTLTSSLFRLPLFLYIDFLLIFVVISDIILWFLSSCRHLLSCWQCYLHLYHWHFLFFYHHLLFFLLVIHSSLPSFSSFI